MVINTDTTVDNLFTGQLYFFEYHNPTSRPARLVVETPLGEREVLNLADFEGGFHLNIAFPRGSFKVVFLDPSATEEIFINYGTMFDL